MALFGMNKEILELQFDMDTLSSYARELGLTLNELTAAVNDLNQRMIALEDLFKPVRQNLNIQTVRAARNAIRKPKPNGWEVIENKDVKDEEDK